MPSPKLPSLFFDAKAGGYWLPLPSAKYLLLGKTDVSLHMRHAGVDGEKDRKSGELSQLERLFMVAQTERSVDYAGPLAGHQIGAFETTDGKRILVTAQARIVEKAKSKSAPFIERFLSQLLGPEQTTALCHWLKVARTAQISRSFSPGQMLVLAGPPGCGKSLLQSLITEFLGGRVGKPYSYMVGETAFNSEICAAEHWQIEDENSSTDIRTRRKFAASIKDATVNLNVRIHAKGREAIALPLFRRITLSVNNEPDNLMILPPLDESILDKVFLLKCSMAKITSDREATWAWITKELPFFIAYVESLRIGPSVACPRFGVRAYHHPELLDALNEIASETLLLGLINEELRSEWEKNDEWEGTADELERRLRTSGFRFAVEKLLHYPSACGRYLGLLAGKLPERVKLRRSNGKNIWRIAKP